jgi:hypothetical protein
LQKVSQGAVSAKTVWGKVVLYLKERKMVALHVACGDITDVEIDSGRLIIHVKEGMIVDLLKEGRREIESALRWQGLELSLQIETIQEKINSVEEDLKKLKAMVGDFLTIR